MNIDDTNASQDDEGNTVDPFITIARLRRLLADKDEELARNDVLIKGQVRMLKEKNKQLAILIAKIAGSEVQSSAIAASKQTLTATGNGRGAGLEAPNQPFNKFVLKSKRTKGEPKKKSKTTTKNKNAAFTRVELPSLSPTQDSIAEDGLNIFHESSVSSDCEDKDRGVKQSISDFISVVSKKRHESSMFFSSSDEDENEYYKGRVRGGAARNNGGKEEEQNDRSEKNNEKKLTGSNGHHEQATEEEVDEHEASSGVQASQEFVGSEYEPNSEDAISSDDNEWGKRKGRR